MNQLYDWCVLFVPKDGEDKILCCPTEQVADLVMAQCKDNCVLTVKYPTRELR